MTINSEIFFKRAAAVFFVSLFITGAFIFSDYGIYWDEEVQRTQVGAINYNYIVTGDNTALLANFHKYYGPAFEVLLSAAEDVFDVTEPRAVYLLRHAICFFSFFIAAICFYLICFKLFKKHSIALLGAVMLVLSPRIFADSFYDSKDLSMLCFCTIAAYTMFVFIEKQTIVTALVHGLLCGFVMDIRIMGVLIPIATVYLFVMQKKKKMLPFAVFLGYTLFSIVVFWPILWMDPINNFIEAFKQMSNYPVMGSTNLYMGENVPAADLPWHYLPVWIGITTPVLYSVFFIKGLFFAAKNIIADFRNTAHLHAILFILFAPVLAVIILNSTLYDGWRHVFFIYPFFILIAVYGFKQVIEIFVRERVIKTIVYSTVAYVAWILIVMIKDHPYQNVYFNMLAGKNLQKRYEMDYWGLSYKQGLEYIAENDKSEQIYVAVQNLPGILNFNMLSDEDKKRLIWTNNLGAANYFLTNFRNHPDDFDFGASVHQIKVGGEKIMEVIKLR
ncbi:MAG: glycosyltransferase family 39 protein [Bacteroidia bacterium]